MTEIDDLFYARVRRLVKNNSIIIEECPINDEVVVRDRFNRKIIHRFNAEQLDDLINEIKKDLTKIKYGSGNYKKIWKEKYETKLYHQKCKKLKSAT